MLDEAMADKAPDMILGHYETLFQELERESKGDYFSYIPMDRFEILNLNLIFNLYEFTEKME